MSVCLSVCLLVVEGNCMSTGWHGMAGYGCENATVSQSIVRFGLSAARQYLMSTTDNPPAVPIRDCSITKPFPGSNGLDNKSLLACDVSQNSVCRPGVAHPGCPTKQCVTARPPTTMTLRSAGWAVEIDGAFDLVAANWIRTGGWYNNTSLVLKIHLKIPLANFYNKSSFPSSKYRRAIHQLPRFALRRPEILFLDSNSGGRITTETKGALQKWIRYFGQWYVYMVGMQQQVTAYYSNCCVT